MTAELPSAEDLRRVFDAAPAYWVGIEDEVMLLDPGTLELAPVADQVLARLADDPRFKAELPTSQIEIVTEPVAHSDEALRALMLARRDLADRTDGLVRLAVAGVHPFSSGIGQLSSLPRYEHTVREYGLLAARELVCALQVHVSMGDAARSLAVYNAARSYLPLLAALAANAPIYERRDTGLASVRPKLAELLPRHGVPPAFSEWEHYADALRWGVATARFEPHTWWWDLRLHPAFGTLEFRVPDGQSTVAEAAALAATIHAIAVWLAERHAAGDSLDVHAEWQIAENSWSACRWGLEGTMVDLQTTTPRPTREALAELLSLVEPVAAALGSSASLQRAKSLIEENGAIRQRRVAAERGPHGVAEWLAERFLEPFPG